MNRIRLSSFFLFFLLLGCVFYFASFSGPITFYGSFRFLTFTIPILILVLFGSIFIGKGLSELFYNVKWIEGSIICFFIVKIIMNLCLVYILSEEWNTIIGWISFGSTKINYTFSIDTLWSVTGIFYVLTKIKERKNVWKIKIYL